MSQVPPELSPPTGERELLTRWTMIGRLSSRDGDDAWRWFLERYRPFARTVLAPVLRDRDAIDRALDEFWGYVFTSDLLRRADRQRRFRPYLVGTLRNFARSWLRQQHAGGASLDDVPPASEPATTDAECAAMRAFAHNVVQNALTDLAREHAESAQTLTWFYGLGTIADGADQPVSAGVIAERQGKQVNAVHVALLRARQRLVRLVEAELRQTVASDDDLAGEIDAVFAAIAAERPGLLVR